VDKQQKYTYTSIRYVYVIMKMSKMEPFIRSSVIFLVSPQCAAVWRCSSSYVQESHFLHSFSILAHTRRRLLQQSQQAGHSLSAAAHNDLKYPKTNDSIYLVSKRPDRPATAWTSEASFRGPWLLLPLRRDDDDDEEGEEEEEEKRRRLTN
jgi:hypothetical protein